MMLSPGSKGTSLPSSLKVGIGHLDLRRKAGQWKHPVEILQSFRHNSGLAASGRPIRRELACLVALAAPIALAQFGVMALGLVDVAILGRTSLSVLGGASLGRSLSFVALSLGFGVAAALEHLAAQAVGAKDPVAAWRAFVATMWAGAIVAVPCMMLEVLAVWALPWFGISAAIASAAWSFVLAQLPSLVIATFYLAGKTYLQAHGRTTPALLGAFVANMVNFATCSILVLGGFGMKPQGAFGAGIANSISYVVLAAFVLVPAFRMRPAARGGAVPLRKVLALGLPVGVQYLAEIGVFALAAVLAGKLGEVSIAAHQIAIGLASFTFMGVIGISGAASVRVGVAIGEGRSPRLPGFLGIGVGATFMLFSGATFFLIPGLLVSIFTADRATALLAVELMSIAALFQLFDGVQGVAGGALRGAGDVRFAFVANAFGHWMVGLPLALLLAFTLKMGAHGLWWGLLTGLGVVAALLTWRFHVVSRRVILRV